jgi:predicted GNAT family acetyltransferase
VIAEQRRLVAAGRFTMGVVESPTEGILASGAVQRVDRVAEVVGVATLPSARRRGFASQLTATLARHAVQNGADLVFLSAGDDDVARLYSRVGFRRIGTACIAEPSATI